MLGRLPVLARDGVGVVAGHVDRRPAEAGLLLALGDDRVERRGLEVAQGMQVEVLGQLGGDSGLSEGLADRVGIRRDVPTRLSGEDEGSSASRSTPLSAMPAAAARSRRLLELLQRAGVDGDRPDAGPRLWGLDRRHHRRRQRRTRRS